MTGSATRSNVIPSLDGVRSVAIIAVIVGHAHLLPSDPASLGVTVFFFLSGFLIMTLLRVEFEKTGKVSLRSFYVRRIFRILPPMYTVLAAATLLTALGFAGSVLNWWGVLGVGTFLSNYMHVWGFRDALPVGTGIFWSLAVEEHFYLVFPVVYLLLTKISSRRRVHGWVILALCLAVLAWRCVIAFIIQPDNAAAWLYYGSDTRADSILWGVLLAVAFNPYLDAMSVSKTRATWLFLPSGVAIVLLAAALPTMLNFTIGFTLIGLGLWPIFITIVRFPSNWIGQVLNWKPMMFIGVLSYGMYLIHRIVQIGIEDYAELNKYLGAVIGAVLVVLIAWLMHLAIEKPAARMRKRFIRSPKTDPSKPELARL